MSAQARDKAAKPALPPYTRPPIDYRTGEYRVIGTVQIGVHIAGDAGVRVMAFNDGLKIALPGLTPEQAEDFGQMLIAAAAQARELASLSRTGAPA